MLRVVVALSLGLAALLPHSAWGARYTLSELIARVKSDYPGVLAAREAVTVSETQLSQANRLWAPIGELNFGLTGVPETRCLDSAGNFNADETLRLNNCIRTSTVDLSKSGFQAILPDGVGLRFDMRLIQPLYTSGKIEAARKAAKAGREVAKGGADAAAADAVLNVTKAYWGIKAARAAGAALDEAIAKIGEWVTKIDKDIDTGRTTYTEIDLVRIKVAFETAQLGRLEVARLEKIALAGLRTLILEADADIDDEEIELSEIMEHPLSYYEDAARSHRPEARMLDAGKQALAAQKSLRLSELLPDFGLLFNFTAAYAQNVDSPNNAFMFRATSVTANLALVLRWSLDFPLRAAKLDQARAEERMFDAKRREALGGIALEIEKHYADLDEARKRVVRVARAEKLSRGWYNAMDQNIMLGVAQARDAVDSATSYFQMRLKHFQSIMDVNVALAALKRSAGVD